MNAQRLYEIVVETTEQFRKGPEITDRTEGRLRVVEVYAMPHENEIPSDLTPVDVHFMKIGVRKERAEARKEELRSILAEYPQPERLAGGPSYIETGAVFGSQEVALRLYALGEVLDFWKVITPAKLGIHGTQADQLAGGGMVMITGFR
jgi:hypothetical protein